MLLQILPNPGGDPETFDLTFNVTDADGAVEGASVTVDNKTGTSQRKCRHCPTESEECR